MVFKCLKICFLLGVVSFLDAVSVSQKTPCETPKCVNLAEEISGKIDNSVDPCDDFYNFACGQYVKKTKITEDKVLIDTFSMVRDTLKDQLKTIITSPIEESDIEPFKMVKGLYKACMNKGETTQFCKLLL